jgi:hypothetical protein
MTYRVLNLGTGGIEKIEAHSPEEAIAFVYAQAHADTSTPADCLTRYGHRIVRGRWSVCLGDFSCLYREPSRDEKIIS